MLQMPLCEVYICPVVHANSKYGEIIKLLARIVLGTLNPFTYKNTGNVLQAIVRIQKQDFELLMDQLPYRRVKVLVLTSSLGFCVLNKRAG